jgi:uncharacterized protein (TIGR03083 family)
MSTAGVEAVRLAVEEVKGVLTTLTDEEWQRPSGCAGWRVQDLVAHMSSNYKETVEPSPPPAEPIELPAEQLMELLVEPRKDWTPQQVLAEYLAYCDAAVAALAALQEEPLASTVIPLADLGQYPMHALADAYAFDHYCHLRVDLLAPTGPIQREVPAADAARLGPAISWMLAGLPQMQPDLPASLAGPLRLTLTGPGGGSWVIAPGAAGITVTEAGDADTTLATIESDGHAFVIWGTARAPWRDHCRVSGDEAAAARFLDALNII